MRRWRLIGKYLAQRMCAFGFLGLLIEVVFTGFKALIEGQLDAPAKTYLPMFFIYGIGGMVLELLDWRISWPKMLKALPMVGMIFSIEFIFGWLFERIYGRCLWLYTTTDTSAEIHPWSVFGLIRLDYFPYWYALSIAYMYVGPKVKSYINKISRL